MSDTSNEDNKALILKAFDTLFNRRDYQAAEAFWSPDYIQHSAHIAPGRAGLFDLIRSAPATLRYEHGLILAEGDHVMVHGRFSGNGRPAPWIAIDILHVADGQLAEHWDVLQDEATRDQSRSGLPMFGPDFPAWVAPSQPTTPSSLVPSRSMETVNVRLVRTAPGRRFHADAPCRPRAADPHAV